jgi:hypothetical protein
MMFNFILLKIYTKALFGGFKMAHNVRDKERMDKVEIWEVLVMLSGNEISLKEAHSQIKIR